LTIITPKYHPSDQEAVLGHVQGFVAICGARCSFFACFLSRLFVGTDTDFERKSKQPMGTWIQREQRRWQCGSVWYPTASSYWSFVLWVKKILTIGPATACRRREKGSCIRFRQIWAPVHLQSVRYKKQSSCF
jgi:hypothetical protein